MDRLITAQCMKIAKTNYENCDSNLVMLRTLRGDYGTQNHPTNQAVVKILNFKEI